MALTTFDAPKYDKVIRNPEFDSIARNTFPIVIGTIGVIRKK